MISILIYQVWIEYFIHYFSISVQPIFPKVGDTTTLLRSNPEGSSLFGGNFLFVGLQKVDCQEFFFFERGKRGQRNLLLVQVSSVLRKKYKEENIATFRKHGIFWQCAKKSWGSEMKVRLDGSQSFVSFRAWSRMSFKLAESFIVGRWYQYA